MWATVTLVLQNTLHENVQRISIPARVSLTIQYVCLDRSLSERGK